MNKKNIVIKIGIMMLILISVLGAGVQGGLFTCNSTGTQQNKFDSGSKTYVAGTWLLPGSTSYFTWVQHSLISDGTALNLAEDPTGTLEIVTTNAEGNFSPVLFWDQSDSGPAHGSYSIILDRWGGGSPGLYDVSSDYIYDFKVVTPYSSPP